MGLYDLLIVEVDLPDPDSVNVKEWQTKTFNCDFQTYKITKEGALLCPRFTRGFTREVNFQRQIWDDIEFHGVLDFCGATYCSLPELPRYFRYKAKFTDGKLVEICGGSARRT